LWAGQVIRVHQCTSLRHAAGRGPTYPSDSIGSTETAGRVPTTRSKECSLSYDLHRDNNPAHVMLHENGVSRGLWQTHMAASHLAACQQATEGAVVAFMPNEMAHIA
jgi:quinol monooxygenase YgiN